jgi:hypothetical protein
VLEKLQHCKALRRNIAGGNAVVREKEQMEVKQEGKLASQPKG